MENKKHPKLIEGFHLQVSRTLRSFKFSLPGGKKAEPLTTEEAFFNLGGLSSKPKGSEDKGNPGSPTVICSNSVMLTSPMGLQQRVALSPILYGQLCGSDDITSAAEAVARFKKNCSTVLKNNVGKIVTPEMVEAINLESCTLYEIKVIGTSVSSTEKPGHTLNKDNGLFYCVRTFRKFYSHESCSLEQLNALANELVTPSETVQVSKGYKVVEGKNGKHSIRSEWQQEHDDQYVGSALERLRNESLRLKEEAANNQSG